MSIRAVLFDMDGTIWDAPIDWLAVRREINVPLDGRPIYMQLMEMTVQERARGIQILERYERFGAENGTIIDGAEQLVKYLHDLNVKCALVTNNTRRSVEHVLSRHPLSFDLVLSRDDGPLKPDPKTFLLALNRLGVSPDETVAIGDAHLDLIASHRAGIQQFILVGSKHWARELLPDGVPYHKAADLMEARTIIARLLSEPS
jgi:HAD superfamily hydrolase (TIGR01549 family)